jgi:hypothetical protein
MRHNSTGCSANSDAAKIGSAAFFEPAAGTLPASATGPSILKQSIAHPSVARPWGRSLTLLKNGTGSELAGRFRGK